MLKAIFFASVSVIVLSFVIEHQQTLVDNCWVSLVETIPENLTYPPGSPSHLTTYNGLLALIEDAKNTIEIASFYWTLQEKDVYHFPSAWEGTDIFQHLLSAGKHRNIDIRIVENKPDIHAQTSNTKTLIKEGHASVRYIDMKKLMGSGIIHTKMWLIDRRHFYIGSANLDWRSLTQVKELGAIISNCGCLAKDMGKIFDAYWYLTKADKVPEIWPEEFNTRINKEHPLNVNLNNSNSNVYLSSSPPPFCASERTSDIDAILDVIYSAKKFVHIAVMDYAPALEFLKPQVYWPVIDKALRNVSFTKGVEVFLLASYWKHTKASMFNFLRSLVYLNGTGETKVQVKMFEVPYFTEEQKKIPFARVNHNKYMVTDADAYIGTSNWSGDYFVSTAGLGLIVRPTNTQQPNLRQQLEDVFQRDWNSKYSHSIDDVDPTKV